MVRLTGLFNNTSVESGRETGYHEPRRSRTCALPEAHIVTVIVRVFLCLVKTLTPRWCLCGTKKALILPMAIAVYSATAKEPMCG